MTRITQEGEENSLSVIKDLFKLYRMRDPINQELGDLIEILGTHGSIASTAVLYEALDPVQEDKINQNDTHAMFVFTGELQNSLTP
jgi:hypothetical protein